MEMPGIDPGASRMQSERSTKWATSPTLLSNRIDLDEIRKTSAFDRSN